MGRRSGIPLKPVTVDEVSFESSQVGLHVPYPGIVVPRKNDSQPAMLGLEPYCEEALSDFVAKANALQRTWWFPS